jgi:hypothetical protein
MRSHERRKGKIKCQGNRDLRGYKRMQKEFFDQIVAPNYLDDLRLTYNAITSMNTAAEFLALHQLGYPTSSRASPVRLAASAERMTARIFIGNERPDARLVSGLQYRTDDLG